MTRPATIHEIGDKSDTECRILFLGDIVGRAARNAIQDQLPQIKSDFGIENGGSTYTQVCLIHK